MNTSTSQRLSRDSWFQTGDLALAEDGPTALKAEPLARRLGTTKGSFYWHFQDVPDFHQAWLEDWLKRHDAELQEISGEGGSAAIRLRRLAEGLADQGTAQYSALALDRSVRAWSLSSSTAARALTLADDHKRAHLQTILDDIGVSNPEIAQLLLAATIGMRQVSTHDTNLGTRAIGSLVDLVLALR